MAIKTTGEGSNLRVLTKTVDGEQRVSCSCCEAGCCMYSAQGLVNGDYTLDDLPEKIVANSDRGDGSFELTLNKSSSSLDAFFYFSDSQTDLVLVSLSTEPEPIWDVGFQIYDASLDPPIRSYGFTSKCLIKGDGNLTQEDDLVEDQFADEYNVEITGKDNFSLNATVTRNELCVWQYSDGSTGVTLQFSDFLQKWIVDGLEDGGGLVNWATFGLKENPQNTPLGTYEVTSAFNLGTGGQFSTAGVTITVSEA
jgi:hypothetical protein